MKIYILIFALLIAASVAQSREPPIQFPPITNGVDTNALARCDASIDQTVFPSLNFNNTPLAEVWNTLVDNSIEYDPSKCGLSIIANLGHSLSPKDMLLPPTPESITLIATDISYRQAINQICEKANLSWRLSPAILVSRPELFLNPELARPAHISELEEWE